MAASPLYFLRRALDAMGRSPFTTAVAVGTISVAVFVTGLFGAALTGAERLLVAWAGDVQISVYLEPGVDLASVARSAGAVAGGREVAAVTPAEALRRLRASLGPEAGVLDGVSEDVLPASVEVRAPGVSLAEARALAARLQVLPGAKEVDFGNAWLERVETLLRRLRWAGLALFGALALATAVLVSNTLRLGIWARRDEIDIMKLVGATDAFVETPFLIEGLVQGLSGAALAVAALLAAHALVAPRLAAAIGVATPLARGDVLPGGLVLALLGGGAALGLVASALAVGRFLRGT
jgi:cell division transport system permease protein